MIAQQPADNSLFAGGSYYMGGPLLAIRSLLVLWCLVQIAIFDDGMRIYFQMLTASGPWKVRTYIVW